MDEFYDYFSKINSLKFEDRSVLVIGGQEMAKQYISALSNFGIKDVTLISKSGGGLDDFCKEKGVKSLVGGFEDQLPNVKKVDLVIIACPILLTVKAAELAIDNGQDNILIEKPGSLYYDELLTLHRKVNSQKIRVGYNRLVYPNLHKLKQLVAQEDGITSCRFSFTEWIHRMDLKKDDPEVYHRWGISNSLHVISMAFELIGMPKDIQTYQHGKFDWHPTGSIFVGSGISDKEIPFSYNADWGSGGRWGIEVNTKENSYQLIPLEDLYVCPKGKVSWDKVPFNTAYPEIKQGIAEEIAIMLDNEMIQNCELITLEKAAKYIQIAEKIFGYELDEK